MADLTRRDRQFLKDLGIESQVQLSEYTKLTYKPLEDAMYNREIDRAAIKEAKADIRRQAQRALLIKLPNHMTHTELFVEHVGVLQERDNALSAQKVSEAHAAEAVASNVAKDTKITELQSYILAESLKADDDRQFRYWGKRIIFFALIGEVVFALFEIEKFLRWIGAGW